MVESVWACLFLIHLVLSRYLILYPGVEVRVAGYIVRWRALTLPFWANGRATAYVRITSSRLMELLWLQDDALLTQSGGGFVEPVQFQRTMKARWDGATPGVTAIVSRSSVDVLTTSGQQMPEQPCWRKFRNTSR